MANALRGEVSFEADGKTYSLRLTANALVEAEALGVEVSSPESVSRIGSVRALLWAGLQAKHPDLGLLAVGELMTEIGLARAAELVGEAIAAAFPKPSGNPR